MQKQHFTILIVDDEPNNLKLLQQILGDHYILKFANKGEITFTRAVKHNPDLILLDIMMPGMDGYEVCKKLKENPDTAKIPVIFVTTKKDISDRKKGFDLGAVDYITKPIEAPILLARVSTHLKLITRERAVTEGLLSLMRAAKLKDNETANHTLRVAVIAYLIAQRLGFDLIEAHHLFLVAPLHDIGKIGVRDEILHYPGNLREHPEMWEEMQAHTVHGADIIGTGIQSVIMQMAFNVSRFHHEKLDGSGYPDKLKGDKIPIEAMITSVADMIDAMLDPTRPYRKGPITEEQVQKFLSMDREVKIPGEIIDAAFALWSEIMAVEKAFPNNSPVPFDKFSYLSPEDFGRQIYSIIKVNE
ncbi:MAG: response regulator [Spirochaetaceae bacterium]|jgi:putative two-component system response regulator|nr:response regulator [Spirochaetaceae bacterium]